MTEHAKNYERNKRYREEHPDRVNASRKKYRENNPDKERKEKNARAKKYRRIHLDIARAHAIAEYGRKTGKIIPDKSCFICGRADVSIEGHHYDYLRPRDLTWVCHRCHYEIHRAEKEKS